jgi:hypothetical protein
VVSQRVFKKLTLFQAEILRFEFRIANFLSEIEQIFHDESG